jgi:ribosome-binding protein aMBF1 (putative translation factor)
MIRNEREYAITQQRMADAERVLAQQRAVLEGTGLSLEEVQRGLDPVETFRAQLQEELAWYDRVRRREFDTVEGLDSVGLLLIAARIANGLSQRELAERLGVSETQVSRDERNEYHGITVERAQRILECLGETVKLHLEEKESVAVS